MNKSSPRYSTTMPIIPLRTASKPLTSDAYSRRFHVMAKPGGAKCNIDCQYCFYLHKEALLHQTKQPVMDEAILEAFIKSYIESQDGDEIVFSWQGGEPTLLGLDYFRNVVALQKKHQPKGVRIENDLQTNGILLNDEWCEFLREHDFLVGLSIDGPRELHDMYRKTRSGKPTFDLVMKAVDKLKQYGVRFNALVTVNRHNVKYPLDVYRFLTKELGVTYIQFTPVVEANNFQTTAPQFWSEQMIPTKGSELAKPGHPMSVVTDWSVDPEDWGAFLIATFEEWVNNDLSRVLVNLFETAVAQVMGKPSQLCVTAEFCGKGLAIEHNGDVFSCDHYVYPEYKLANIKDHSLNDMALSTRQYAFGVAKRESLPNYCTHCPYLSYCWGECPKNRLIKTCDGEMGLNYLCSGIKAFFDYSLPMLVGLAEILRAEELKR